jgi:CRISPR/Cas system-associated protein Cas10 (large subunit of type III CRISPR-Cas system)
MEKITKIPQTKKEQKLELLRSEIEKDMIDLENEKRKFIEQIKKVKKEEIIKPKEEKKLTLWNRIKKVLTGI